MNTVPNSDVLSCVLVDDNQDHLELMRHSITASFKQDDLRINFYEFNDPAEGLANLPAQ